MEKEFFDLLGLGVPFGLATATYVVFTWLDSNASDEATKVISSWLHGRSQHKPDLGNLIIKAFDRVYTSPLLRFRAFGRSATISSIIWLLVFFVPLFVRLFTYRNSLIGSTSSIISMLVPINFGDFAIIVITDYVSLFLYADFSI
jgi:hypothetical protein